VVSNEAKGQKKPKEDDSSSEVARGAQTLPQQARSCLDQRPHHNSCHCPIRIAGRRYAIGRYTSNDNPTTVNNGHSGIVPGLRALARLGLRRLVVMIVPSHASVLDVVAKSDLVGTVPASLAERAERGSKARQGFHLPLDTSIVANAQTWHSRLGGDAAISGCARKFAKCAAESDHSVESRRRKVSKSGGTASSKATGITSVEQTRSRATKADLRRTDSGSPLIFGRRSRDRIRDGLLRFRTNTF
jgi:hypothetical protein